MMKYKSKPITIEAIQWFKTGDHPDVDEHGTDFTRFKCNRCRKSLEKEHGWLYSKNGGPVCPGDWIITKSNGEVSVMNDADFHIAYEPVRGMK